jgi:hypothetical protein
MRAAAQTYERISHDTVVVSQAFRKDTMCIYDVLRINESYDWEKKTKLNEELFLELKRPKRREE